MPRTFNGTSDTIDFTYFSSWAYGSMWYVGYTNDLAGVGQAITANDSGTNRFLFGLTAGELPRLNIGGTSSLATTAVPIQGWYLSGVSKATGSQTPRFHTYVYSTNTWTHEAGSVALADASTTATAYRMGAGGSGAGANFFDGSIAAVALASQTVLSDAEFENLAHDLNQWLTPGGGGGNTVTAMWILDQASTGQTIHDIRGSTAATSNDQSAISGTSVAASSIGSPIGYGLRAS